MASRSRQFRDSQRVIRRFVTGRRRRRGRRQQGEGSRRSRTSVDVASWLLVVDRGRGRIEVQIEGSEVAKRKALGEDVSNKGER